MTTTTAVTELPETCAARQEQPAEDSREWLEFWPWLGRQGGRDDQIGQLARARGEDLVTAPGSETRPSDVVAAMNRARREWGEWHDASHAARLLRERLAEERRQGELRAEEERRANPPDDPSRSDAQLTVEVLEVLEEIVSDLSNWLPMPPERRRRLDRQLRRTGMRIRHLRERAQAADGA
jgi:hypothetical protein